MYLGAPLWQDGGGGRPTAQGTRAKGPGAKGGGRNLHRAAHTQRKERVKAKAASEDDERRAQDDIQKLTDRFVGEIDKLLQGKEQELLTV